MAVARIALQVTREVIGGQQIHLGAATGGGPGPWPEYHSTMPVTTATTLGMLAADGLAVFEGSRLTQIVPIGAPALGRGGPLLCAWRGDAGPRTTLSARRSRPLLVPEERGAHEVLTHEPHLHLVCPDHIRNQQVVGAVIAGLRSLAGHRASCLQDDLVRMKQP